MQIFIIDLEGSVSAFEPIKPFWYPLQRDGSLHIIAAAGGKTQRQKAVTEMLDWLRAGRGTSKWQIIFLSAPPPRPRDGMSFVGCLTDRLQQVLNEFLAPLSGEDSKPSRVLLLDLDAWAKDEFGVPVDERGREQWQLDMRGYVERSEDGSPLFSTADIREVTSKWGGPRVLNGVHVDQGLSSLAEELQKTIREEFDQAKMVLADLVQTKKGIIKEFTADGCCRFLDPEVLNQLLCDFNLSLKRRLGDRNISWIHEQENPFAAILTDLLRKTYSALSVSNLDIVCVRFPNSDWSAEQQNSYRSRLDLLRLTYFLIFLCEQECRLDPGHLWRVEKVELDTKYLDACFCKTISRWKVHAGQIEEQCQKSQYVSCSQTVSPCGGDSLLKDFKKPSGPGNTREKWRQWRQEQKGSLDTYGIDADTMLAQAWRQMLRGDGVETRQFDDLACTIRQYEQEAASLRQELRQKSFQPMVHDWPACVAELAGKIGDFFVTKCSWHQRLRLYIIALSLLLIPYILTVAPQGGVLGALKSPRVLTGLLIQLGIVVLLDIMLTASRNFKEKQRKDKALDILQKQGENLKKVFANNRLFQQKICELSVLVKNLRALKHEQQKNDLKQKQTALFKKEFDIQCGWLSQFIGDPPLVIPRQEMDNSFICQVKEPPGAQREFGLLAPMGDYTWQIDGSLNKSKSCNLPGLCLIDLHCLKGVELDGLADVLR